MPLRALLLATLILLEACSGDSDNHEIESRIAAVQTSLLPAVVEKGRPLTFFTLQERMAYYLTPGVSIAVITDGRIEWTRGFGAAEQGREEAIDAGTLFQAASISKPLAAGAVMLLAQAGRIDIDAEANAYLTSWKIPDNEFTAQRKVSVRMLLSHTAVTTVSGFDGYLYNQPLPALLQTLDGLPPANNIAVRVEGVPGSRFQYSGGGMEILQQLVEDVTGTSYAQQLQESIFSPLAMSQSGYPINPGAPMAIGHNGLGEVIAGGWNRYPEFAAAGLWTTPGDLARYLLAIQASAMGAQGGLFQPETAAAMLTPQARVNDEASMGLGFLLSPTSFGHSGANEGFKNRMVAFIQQAQGAVVMTNSDNGADLADEILRGISHVYGWPQYQPEEVDLLSLPVETLDAYAGRYQSGGDASSRYLVARSGEDLIFTFEGVSGVPYSLYPVSSDTFLIRTASLLGNIKFLKDSRGRVKGFSYTGTQDGTAFTANRG